MIPSRTLQRIHFFGTDYRDDLLKYIAPENLPVRSRLINKGAALGASTTD